MARLSVNVNKVATLRNTRDVGIPSVAYFARIALEAGAAGITVHPRPDQRHIRGRDVEELAELLARFPSAEFNVEGNPFHDYLPLVRKVRPTQCTLVPDEVGQSTSDHGFDLRGDTRKLRDVVSELRGMGSRVSLFLDPDERQMELAAEIGADRVELYTAPYAHDFAVGKLGILAAYQRAAETARDSGLELNAGHDLSLANLPPLMRAIPFIAEVSIGHALIADALEFGMAETVRKYIKAAAV
jgi:pyridoxine 5-phosphate synthase